MKKAIQQAFDSGAKGIKIQTKGRLAGSEIARGEGYLEGTVPLHTLRADIDYGFSEANTTYGKIGVKVIVYKGDILKGLKGAPQAQGVPAIPAATPQTQTEAPSVAPDA